MTTDHKDLWRNVLQRLEPTMRRSNFVTWFQNTGVLKFEAGVLILGFPHVFAKEWIERHYVVKILSVVKELDPSISRLVFQVEPLFGQGNDSRVVPLDAILTADPEKTVRKLPNASEVKIDGELRSKMFNPRYRLDNFFPGRNNRLPHAACMAVANQPGGIYNPLFLYGGVGLGKTHLLQATGREILKNYPKKIVVYMTSENFVNEVVQAIKSRRIKEFKDRYRKVDCFIVDDVQFFAEKSHSQEEFFYTINDLYEANKQILLSSDHSPKDLQLLDDRLRSRFSIGMVTELLTPEYETRLAILQEKSHEAGVILDHEVLGCIAYHVEKSVRELEGVFKGLIARMQLEQIVPTVQDALEIIQRLHGVITEKSDNVSSRRFVRNADEILSVVSKYFSVSKQDLLGDDRRKEILLPRQICMYLIRQELDQAYEKIGADFGGKNHTTVLHACNKIVENLQTDPRLVHHVHEIRKELGL